MLSIQSNIPAYASPLCSTVVTLTAVFGHDGLAVKKFNFDAGFKDFTFCDDHRDTTDIAVFCSKVLAGFAVLVQSVSLAVLFLLHAV